MAKLLWILVGVLLVAGCGGTGGADNQNAQPAESAPESVQGSGDEQRETVFDPMIGTMDRAAGVEDLSMSRKEEMDAAIDK